MPKPPVEYRAMTDRERLTALALGECSFPTASFSKRFAAGISMQAAVGQQITEKQSERLFIQAYIYRRQMPAELVPASPPPGYQTPKQRAQNS